MVLGTRVLVSMICLNLLSALCSGGALSFSNIGLSRCAFLSGYCSRAKNRFNSNYSTVNKMSSVSPELKETDVTIFHKVVSGEIPCKKVYEDDLVLAFHDINPQAPTHILVIPKVFDGLSQLSKATERHEKVLGHMLVKVAHIVRENNLGDFRLVVNSGPKADQTVFYLHMHILAGRNFSWPPG